MLRSRRLIVAPLGCLLAVVLAPSVDAAPSYRDPPGYKGIKKAPQTAPPPSATANLSATGVFPDVVVDEAGTAHIVWNEGRGDDADAAIYCRLPRAATVCEQTVTLVWNKTYGAGDSPQFNTDNLGPRIVRVGDQLVVFSKRYPTIGDKPDGASSSTVVGWVSNDGGKTWSSAKILGKYDLGEMAVLGPENDPTIVNLGYDPFCGGTCVTTFKSGQYSGNGTSLNTGPNSNYHGTLARDGASLIAGFSDLEPRIWLRTWSGAGSMTDPAQWSTSAPIGGDEPRLAGGPAGPFLMHRPGYSGPYQVRRLSTGAGNNVQAGAPVPISAATGATGGRLAQDPSGRLLAAFQQRDSGVQLRTSTGGADGFDPPKRLIDGNENGQINLDAAGDGGGTAVLNHTGGITSAGQIKAVGFGNRAPTGKLGLGDLPGGGDVTCDRVGFGGFAIETVEGCFLKGTGKSSRVVVTGGEITLNGLVIDPDPGSRLVIDPVALTIDTVGQARVLVRNGSAEIVLFHGKLSRDLAGLRPGARLFEFPQGQYQASVLGFEVAAGVPVFLTETGVRIPVDVKLPGAFGGFTGHAELTADAENGLKIDSLRIHIGPVPLGVLMVDSIDLDWAVGGTWRGAGKVSVPAGGSIAAHFEFEMGEFAGAGFDYTLAPPATIGPFVYLLSVGGDLSLRPVQIAARASIGAGAALQGQAPVKVNGLFTMRFPPSAPASFKLLGTVDLFVIRVGEGYLEFQTDGYAEFGGNSRLALGPLSGGVDVEGFIDATGGQFGADINGDAKFCLDVVLPAPAGTAEVCGDVGARAAVSSVGFAACARLNPPDPFGGFTAGLALRWDELSPAVLASPIVATGQLIEAIAIPCSTSAYRLPPPRPKRPPPPPVRRRSISDRVCRLRRSLSRATGARRT